MKKKLQKLAWAYLIKVFRAYEKVAPCEPRVTCSLVPITMENADCVALFRPAARVAEYREKLALGEIGYFATDGTTYYGSIWATVNLSDHRKIVHGYMPLKPFQALIHDAVTAEASKGKGIGPFMIARLIDLLLAQGVQCALIDVNTRNHPSLRMMEKTGLLPITTEFFVSLFGHPVIHFSRPAVDYLF